MLPSRAYRQTSPIAESDSSNAGPAKHKLYSNVAIAFSFPGFRPDRCAYHSTEYCVCLSTGGIKYCEAFAISGCLMYYKAVAADEYSGNGSVCGVINAENGPWVCWLDHFVLQPALMISFSFLLNLFLSIDETFSILSNTCLLSSS